MFHFQTKEKQIRYADIFVPSEKQNKCRGQYVLKYKGGLLCEFRSQGLSKSSQRKQLFIHPVLSEGAPTKLFFCFSFLCFRKSMFSSTQVTATLIRQLFWWRPACYGTLSLGGFQYGFQILCTFRIKKKIESYLSSDKRKHTSRKRNTKWFWNSRETILLWEKRKSTYKSIKNQGEHMSWSCEDTHTSLHPVVDAWLCLLSPWPCRLCQQWQWLRLFCFCPSRGDLDWVSNT